MSSIDEKYETLGGPAGFLGEPTSQETTTPDGIGCYRHFQNGSIYWTPETGAHEVHGAIRVKWSHLGWERSFLGYPVTDESTTPDRRGRYNHFQRGSIYWTRETGAHEVHGAIRVKWSHLGWERSYLGYPVTDETGLPRGSEQYNLFQNGSIHWTPELGAYDIADANSSASAVLFESTSGGRYMSLAVPSTERYAILSSDELMSIGLANSISAAVMTMKDAETSLYLFDGTANIPNSDYRRRVPAIMMGGRFSGGRPTLDFHGEFLRFTKPEERNDEGFSGSVYISDLATRGFNDRTMSALLVTQWHDKCREERISARKIFTLPWVLAWDHIVTPIMDNATPGAKFSRYGDPLFSWIAFPRTGGLSDSRIYITASQWIGVHASGIGMNAWLVFYLTLHTQGGALKVNIEDVNHWVWPGTGQGQLMDGLASQKSTIMSAAQILFGSILACIPSRCDDIYLLPGDQTGGRPSTPDVRPGDAIDDVTVVLVNPTTDAPSITSAFKG